PLAALRDSIHSAIGDALKTSEPGLFDQWSALKDQYSTASQAMEQEAYKSLTTATDPAKFLNKFFGKGATLERIYSLKNVVGQDNFQELGRAFLVQNILPAFKEVTESGADDLSTQQTIFNSLQFQKNIASISDAKWQQILDPQTYLRLNAFKADAADFETIVKKGLGGAKQFSEGSKTTPMYRALRYVSPVTTGAGLAVVGGLSLATGGIITGLTLLLGDAGLARFVGSDIGQSILGSNSIMSRAANGLSHLAPPGTGVAAGIAQQAAAANNASTEQQAGKLKQLTPAQLQGLQTQSQTMDPKGLAGARSQLAKLGYQIPDFLFQTNGSTTTQAGQ
ncbi:MAG TPA: hypothetical protein VN922_25195, partial [Bacteroidia bacterium]|nr:hypothetical protein [Bacteroidia bacterium]